jgi:hypothetical protein
VVWLDHTWALLALVLVLMCVLFPDCNLTNTRSSCRPTLHPHCPSPPAWRSFLDAGVSLEELLAMEEPLRYGQQGFVPPLGAAPLKRPQLVAGPVVQGGIELNDDATQLLVGVSPAANEAAAAATAATAAADVAACGVPATSAAPSCSGSPQHSRALSLGSSHMVPKGVSPVVVTGVRSVAPAAARKSKGLASAGSLSSLHSSRTVLESGGCGSPVGPMQAGAAAAAAGAVEADKAPPAAVGVPYRARIRVGGRLLSKKAAQSELRRLQSLLNAGVAGASSKSGHVAGGGSGFRKTHAHTAPQQQQQQQQQGASPRIQVPDLPDDPFEAFMSGACLDDPLGCSYSSISDSPLPGSGDGLCGSHSSATSLSVLGLPDEDWLDPLGRLEDPHWDLLAPSGPLGGPCTGPPPWPPLCDPVPNLGDLCDDLELPGLPVVKAEQLAVSLPARPLLPEEGWELGDMDSSLPTVPQWEGAELPVSPPTTSTAASCQLTLDLSAADVVGSWAVPSDTGGDTGAAPAPPASGGMGSKLDAGSSSSLQQCLALPLTGGMSRQGSCNTPQASPAAPGLGVSSKGVGMRDAGVRVVNVSLAVKSSSPVKAATPLSQGKAAKPAEAAVASILMKDAPAAAAARTGDGGIPHLPDLATAKEKLSKLPYDKLLAVAARVAATASSGQPAAVFELLDDPGMVDSPTTAGPGGSCVPGTSPGCKRPAQEELVGPDRWHQHRWGAAPLAVLTGNQ